MDRREPMSGINRNNLSTPSRPLSREQFFSVRERIVKDTPKLYQGRSIATDEKKERTDERVFTPTSSINIFSHKSQEPIQQTVERQTVQSHDLGFFENPVLEKLAERSVNKSLEVQKIINNVLLYLLWNLITKFILLYLDHTSSGQKVRKNWLQTDQILALLHMPNNKAAENAIDLLFSVSSFNKAFRGLVLYNVLMSIFALVGKVKISDLKLNQRQKNLLGFIGQGETSNLRRIEPSNLMLKQNSKKTTENTKDQRVSSGINKKNTESQVSAPPYAFRSIQTPMKKKMEEERNSNMNSVSNNVNPLVRSNIFNNNASTGNNRSVNFAELHHSDIVRRNSTITTLNDTSAGYIPSSKYTYMMDTPSPRKSFK